MACIAFFQAAHIIDVLYSETVVAWGWVEEGGCHLQVYPLVHPFADAIALMRKVRMRK